MATACAPARTAVYRRRRPERTMLYRTVQTQATADADYFIRVAGRAFDADQRQAIHATTLAAYRWQYITSGVQGPRFLALLGSLTNAEQGARIHAALAPIVGAVH